MRITTGFLSFDVNGIAFGATTQVTVLLPEGKSANTYWNYSPNQGWYEFLYDGTTGAEFLDSNNDGALVQPDKTLQSL
jgi:hypothetical protein